MTANREAEIIPFRTLLKKQIASKSTDKKSLQLSLFPCFDEQIVILDERLVVLVNIESISGDQLFELITDSIPSVIFELRPCPRFDLDGIDRPSFLKTVKEHRIKYFDLARSHGILTSDDPRLHPITAADLVSKEITSLKPDGPILIFLNNTQKISEYLLAFPNCLKPLPQKEWNVCSY